MITAAKKRLDAAAARLAQARAWRESAHREHVAAMVALQTATNEFCDADIEFAAAVAEVQAERRDGLAGS